MIYGLGNDRIRYGTWFKVYSDMGNFLFCKNFMFTGWVESSAARRCGLGTEYAVVSFWGVWKLSYSSSISTPYHFGCYYTVIPISYVNICVLNDHLLGSQQCKLQP